MTDNLRDRIIKVQAEHVQDQLTNYNAGRNECGCGLQGADAYRQHLADAVIKALGLREEREDVASFQPGEIDDSMMPPRQKGRLTWTPSHRYVTDWTSEVNDDG